MSTPERRIALGVAILCVLIYIPYLGNYGLWDPWETHYGEVARQMASRGDYISMWWPGSPDERPEFWSKPVGTFWILALALKAAGLESASAAPSEMVASWRVEWALRLPMVLLAMAAILATWALARRAGERAAALAALILMTSPGWILVSRQAVTDMPFIAPMTIALALAGLALLSPEMELVLPRRRWRALSWPSTPAFYGFIAIFAIVTIPQLIMISIQLHCVFNSIHLPGLVPMLPYVGAFGAALVLSARARTRRQLYLLAAWVLCAVATLAKGPAGLAMPGLVLLFYLVCAGRWREIWRLELGRGALVFVAAALPWYHAMLIRHGMGFWNEFIGDNYVKRALGRHGDRGSFDYYLPWIGYGMFPWSGMAALGTLGAFRPRAATAKSALAGFALVWLLIDLAIVTLVNTKFHHYILPAFPALAILAALALDELLSHPRATDAAALLLLVAPITFLAGRDLAALPARVLWLFNYDYVNMPGTGRPWPSSAQYGARYEYGVVLLAFAVAAALVVTAFALGRRRRAALAAWVALAVGAALFIGDRMMLELSPHWSQKAVLASYYAQRAGAGEPLLVWQVKWRGENFYTRNEIHRAADAGERTVFLAERADSG